MPRFIVTLLVLVFASYSVGHKVFTVPLTVQNVDTRNAADSAIKYNSDPSDLELREDNEEFEIYDIPYINSIFYVTMWYPTEEYYYDRRFMLDTNSSGLAADLRGCYDCMWDLNKLSTTFKQYHNCSEQNITLAFPHLTTDGKICKASLSLKKDVPWFYVEDVDIAVFDYYSTSSTNYAWLEGVMGLAPSSPNGTENFVQLMKKQGVIDVAAFNIDYRYISDKYSMTFGGFDAERTPYLSNFTFTSIYDEYSWSVGLSSMRYGELDFGGQAVKAILETPDFSIRLPPEDYKRWHNYTTYQKPCGPYGGNIRCNCRSITAGNYDSLYFSFGGYSYEVPPESYIDFRTINRATYCIFNIAESKDPLNSTVVLGQAFLKNFNVYYDMENKQIGLYGKRAVYTGGSYSGTGGGPFKSPGSPNGSTGGEGGTTGGGDTEGGGSEGGSTGGDGTEGIKEEAGIIIGTIKQLLGSLTQLGLVGILLIASLILNLILLFFCCLNRKEKDEEDDKEEPLLQPRGDSV